MLGVYNSLGTIPPHEGKFSTAWKMAKVDCVLKIVLVGDSSTGKTTLIHRYVDGKCIHGLSPSIGQCLATLVFVCVMLFLCGKN